MGGGFLTLRPLVFPVSAILPETHLQTSRIITQSSLKILTTLVCYFQRFLYPLPQITILTKFLNFKLVAYTDHIYCLFRSLTLS